MSADVAANPGQWCLYLLECEGGKLYAGITNNLVKRLAAHAAGKGARYTRANPPKRVLGWAPFEDRSAASKAEWDIKQLPKAKKLDYIRALVHTPGQETEPEITPVTPIARCKP